MTDESPPSKPLPEALPGEVFLQRELKVSLTDSAVIGSRIDRVLASLDGIETRSQASRLISRGLVRLGELAVKSSYVVKAGDCFQIYVPTIPKLTLVPYDFPLIIPYEDEDLIVVDKPAGLVVHPAYGHAQDTLVNALLHHTRDLSQGFDQLRPGLVHRLDKDTSGLIVIAKNEKTQRELALQFQRKITHRLYRAIVFGAMNPLNGTISSSLKRHPEDRRRSASVAPGTANAKHAITHYRTLMLAPSGLSLLELKLETGRTHQIRVHVTEAGHPIAGDTMYGANRRVSALKSVAQRKLIEALPRFALHAFELGFFHPRAGDFLRLKSIWPNDLRPLVEHCGFPEFDRDFVIERFAKRPADDFAWPKVRSEAPDTASESDELKDETDE